MKRQKRMMILLGILAVCTAGTVAVSRIDFEEKMSETETAIIDIDSADITRLAWNYEEEVSFVRQDGEWQQGDNIHSLYLQSHQHSLHQIHVQPSF